MGEITMNKFIGLLFASLVLVGCGVGEDSDDVNQERIYADYEIFYNANEGKTHAIARFRFGNAFGTLLELKPASGASVTYNGDALAYSSFWGGHHKEYAGNNETGGTFIYTNTEDTVFTNVVPSDSTISFPSGFDTIDKNIAQTLAWDGSSLASNDQIGIFVGSWVWGDDALFYTDADNATEIVFGINQMQNLATGSATVYMDRWNAQDVSEGTPEGGRIRYKYRTTNAIVTVIDSSAR